MPNGRPSSETDIGRWLSCTTSARRVGSPRASKTLSAAPLATPLAVRPHAEREVRDAGGVDDAGAFQGHALRVDAIEQPRPVAEQDVDEMELQLVEQPGLGALPDEVGAAEHRDVLAARGLLRPREGGRDA